MTLRTLFAYLFGSRDAILRIVATRDALTIGALLVLSASLAREYDGEDLLHRPIILILPFAASIAISFVMFLLVALASWQRDSQPIPFVRGYRGFLALYWLTAPLAWLYAIPWERLVGAKAAAQANLITLAIVSAWRFLLIVRSLGVLTGSYIASGVFVLFASSIGYVVAAYFSPIPLYALMSGIRLSPAEQWTAETQVQSLMIAWHSLPLLGLLSLVLIAGGYQREWTVPRPAVDRPPRLSRGLILFSAAAVALWTPILFLTQPEQINRRRVDALIDDGRIGEAFSLLRELPQSSFPPHWKPPPELTGTFDEAQLFAVMARLRDEEMPAWVRTAYVETFASLLTSHFVYYELDLQQAQVIAYWAEHEPKVRQAICLNFNRLQFAAQLEHSDEVARDAHRPVAETLTRVVNLVADECGHERPSD